MNACSPRIEDDHSPLIENMTLMSSKWTMLKNNIIEANLNDPVPPMENRRRIMGALAESDPDGSMYLASGRKTLNIYKDTGLSS